MGEKLWEYATGLCTKLLTTPASKLPSPGSSTICLCSMGCVLGQSTGSESPPAGSCFFSSEMPEPFLPLKGHLLGFPAHLMW